MVGEEVAKWEKVLAAEFIPERVNKESLSLSLDNAIVCKTCCERHGSAASASQIRLLTGGAEPDPLFLGS